jgi:hypothetical protein
MACIDWGLAAAIFVTSGTLATLVTNVVASPLDLLKTLQQTDPENRGLLETGACVVWHRPDFQFVCTGKNGCVKQYAPEIYPCWNHLNFLNESE